MIEDHIIIEPARYAMTGISCGAQMNLKTGYGYIDMWCLDAPEFIAKGSLSAATSGGDGKVYAWASDAIHARLYGGGQ